MFKRLSKYLEVEWSYFSHFFFYSFKVTDVADARDLEINTGTIEFKDVKFRYEPRYNNMSTNLMIRHYHIDSFVFSHSINQKRYHHMQAWDYRWISPS